MNYCSLQDAWGNSNYISNQYKEYMKPDSKSIETFQNTDDENINSVNANASASASANGNANANASANNASANNANANNASASNNINYNNINCNNVFEHIRKCKKCYKKMKSMMKSKLLTNFENMIQENKDIIVTILIGISIVLFFNLINNITK
jgi:uncharacterized membrane protein YraQ (UPF0718 family)